MPRVSLKKIKHQSVPLPDPMTSVMQEINGVKRKVTSTSKKQKIMATSQSGKATSAREIFSETEDVGPAKDGPTRILNETKIAAEVQDKSSLFNRTNTKPRQLLLDPSELQSISKLQNWTPSIRNPTEKSTTENKILNKFTSQGEYPDDLKSNHHIIKSTQYKSFKWNPPLRKKSFDTETSETPAKKAKMLETIKPSHISKEVVASSLVGEDHNSSQPHKQSQSQNASTPQNLASLEDKIQSEYSQLMGVNKQNRSSQDLDKPFEAQNSCEEKLDNGGNLSYSPTATANNQQLLEKAHEDNLAENLDGKSSQNSEQDMFLSQEPMGESLCPKIHMTNLSGDELTSQITENFGENSEDEEYMETEKPNSVESKKVNEIQELLNSNMAVIENQNEDPFDINPITEEAKLDSASQRERSDGGVVVKKVQEDKEITSEVYFHSIKEKPTVILKSPQRGSQQSEPGLILSPAISGVCINVTPPQDLMKTPPNQFEQDIFSCPTVKRIITEISDAELPEQLEVDQLSEAPIELNLPCDTDTLDSADESEVKIQSNIEISYDNARFPDASSATSLVGTVKVDEGLKFSHSSLEEVALKVEDKDEGDFNVGSCGLQDCKHTKSENVANLLSKKDFDISMRQTESNDIFKDGTVQDEPSDHAFQLAEDNKVVGEEVSLKESTILIKVGNEIDANASAVNRIDLPTKVEISRTIKNIAFKDQKNHGNFSQDDKTQEQALETEVDLNLVPKNKLPCEAEINPKMIETEKVLPDEGVGNLLQSALRKEDKDKISQDIEMESKKMTPLEKVHPMEVDSSKSTVSGGNSKANRHEDKGNMKPYTFEIEQDFDISHSQLIEIESAIMRECREPGPTTSSVTADAMPREAATFPGIATGTCGEARMGGFSMPRVPTLPTLNWKKKVQEDRQKLRAAIHEISRLNAMLMSVRREVWPSTGVNPEPSTLNQAPNLRPGFEPTDSSRQGHGPGPRRY